MKKLYYGDNLQVLRNYIKEESIDLIYLDPPFNSQASYNILFKSPKGDESQAQIQAFEDTWSWGIESENFLLELKDKRGELWELLDLLVRTLGKNSLSAYLVMMAIRLVELHRVLKQTGSLYLHCDPTASHYLKMILDIIFGAINFRNEIIWKRTSAHSSAKKYGSVHDIILYYTKSNQYTWNLIYTEYNEKYVKEIYRFCDEKGPFRVSDLTAKGSGKGESSQPWRGIDPKLNKRHWAIPTQLVLKFVEKETLNKMSTQEKLDLLNKNGYIYWPKKGGMPRYKGYLEDSKGVPLQDVITDISPLTAQAKEKLGYPTQKPLALLERIITASSNENDVILDPFCGCGTAIHAAEKLGRNWVGIDITHLAISLIEKRLKDSFPDRVIKDEQTSELITVKGIEFEVEGTPKDLASAQDLFNRDAYQFQWWAVSLVNAQPYQGKKKGSDQGIDGIIYFKDCQNSLKNKEKTTIEKIIISVKGGKNIGAAMIRDLVGTMTTNKAKMGIFITLTTPTKPMLQEAAKAGFYQAGNGQNYPVIQILTIEELLLGNKKAEYFDLSRGELNFKKAQKEDKNNSIQTSLFEEE